MPANNKDFNHGRKKQSILPNLSQPVNVLNKYPAVCDTCGNKKPAGQVTLSADPGDKRWTGECLNCEDFRKNATEGSLYGDWETPAEGGDIDRDYHGK